MIKIINKNRKIKKQNLDFEFLKCFETSQMILRNYKYLDLIQMYWMW
jgi:hypothetical protein